jgi:hypothetical protein
LLAGRRAHGRGGATAASSPATCDIEPMFPHAVIPLIPGEWAAPALSQRYRWKPR